MDLSYLYNFLDDKDRTILSKKRIIFKGVIFYIKSLIIVSITILGIITILNIFKIDTSTLISSFKEDVEELQEKGILYAIFMIVFFSPFIEEIACRLGLSFKRNHMAFSAFALVYILLSLITKSSYFEEVSYNNSPLKIYYMSHAAMAANSTSSLTSLSFNLLFGFMPDTQINRSSR